VDWLEVGSDGVVVGGGMSTAGGFGSTGGAVLVEDPEPEPVVDPEPEVDEPEPEVDPVPVVDPESVDAGGDEPLLLVLELSAVEPFPPPPPQATSNVATARPMSEFLFTFFPIETERKTVNHCMNGATETFLSQVGDVAKRRPTGTRDRGTLASIYAKTNTPQRQPASLAVARACTTSSRSHRRSKEPALWWRNRNGGDVQH
jgi:hypothetical protein